MTYYEASRGRSQVLSSELRKAYAKPEATVYEPKGVVHAVSAAFPSRTLCHLETLQLRTFPDLDFDRPDPADRERCDECVRASRPD